jgi:hypothetical protein
MKLFKATLSILFLDCCLWASMPPNSLAAAATSRAIEAEEDKVKCFVRHPSNIDSACVEQDYPFLGCFEETVEERALIFPKDAKTKEACRVDCAEYKLFGLDTQGECYCGKHRPHTRLSDSCEPSCSNCLSVYKVCPIESVGETEEGEGMGKEVEEDDPLFQVSPYLSLDRSLCVICSLHTSFVTHFTSLNYSLYWETFKMARWAQSRRSTWFETLHCRTRSK